MKRRRGTRRVRYKRGRRVNSASCEHTIVSVRRGGRLNRRKGESLFGCEARGLRKLVTADLCLNPLVRFGFPSLCCFRLFLLRS